MNESQICLFLLSSQHCNLVKYINLLTSYAFKHLENQMSLMKEVKEAKSTNLLLDVHVDCQQFEVESGTRTIMVSVVNVLHGYQ